MVAENPLFHGSWTLKKLKATVVNDIWPEVALFTLIATMVTLVSTLTSHSLAISNQVLTVLGTVLGLVISFRTSSAYERYSDGRKLWTNMSIASRNLAQIIWVHIPTERIDKISKERQSTLRAVIEKKSMINLVQAFSVSVKHMLRGEGGVYYEDLYPLICFLPRYCHNQGTTENDMLPMWKASSMDTEKHRRAHTLTSRNVSPEASRAPSRSADASLEKAELGEAEGLWHPSLRGRPKKKFDPEQALPFVYSEHPLRPARNPPKESIYDYLPFLQIFKLLLKPFSRRRRQEQAPAGAPGRSFTGKKLKPEAVDSNVPLEITLFLSSYLAWLLRNGMLQPALATAMTNGIASLQDTVTNLDRIRNTPLPFAYQAHLRISLWLYLFFLPFQIFDAFHWLTIPATAFTSFLLLGFLEIGQEIENPFNYDLNDLDLDQFCLSIQRELQEITAHTSPEPDHFIFSPWNQPFAPADRRNAEEMMNDVDHAYHGPETGMLSMRRTLLKSWWDVDQMTRQ